MVIGFRCSTDKFVFVILNGTRSEPIIIGSGRRERPREFSHPEFLKWARERIQEIISDPNIVRLGYKRAETIRPARDKRLHLEGVLIECASSRGIPEITDRLKSQIRRDLAFTGEARDVGRVLRAGPLAQFYGSEELADAALVALCLLEE